MAITMLDPAESKRRRTCFRAWCRARGYEHRTFANGTIAYRVGKRWLHCNADRWVPGEYEDLDPTDNASIMQCVRRMTGRVESTRIP